MEENIDKMKHDPIQDDNRKNQTLHTRKSKSLTSIYLIGIGILAIIIIAGVVTNLSRNKQSVEEVHDDAYRHAETHGKTEQPKLLNNSEKLVTSISKSIISIDKPAKSEKKPQKHTAKMADKQTKTFTINEINDALNDSGMTRVLSMKIAKLYGIQVLKDYPIGKKQLAKRDLGIAKRTMNEIYEALLAYSPIASSKEMVKIVKASCSSWHHMEKLLSAPPSKTGLLDILNASDKLLEDNEMMTSYVESLSPIPISELINMSGRQQMFAQRLARDYLAVSMGIDKEHRMDLMLDSAIEFESAMSMIEGATENTTKIKGIIKSITRMEWRKVYETATECIESDGIDFNVTMMTKFCDTLLDKTNRLTKLYVGM